MKERERERKHLFKAPGWHSLRHTKSTELLQKIDAKKEKTEKRKIERERERERERGA